jgi:DHA1 family bicyclomycin/chloramphenicol resistance-like MFS transporter
MNQKFLLVFIILISAFPPLSTDMSLPALPEMGEYFKADEFQINLTLIVFFVVFAVATLIWGPISDKYGRKPTLITGLVIYFVGSFLCGIAESITLLILFRVLQAIGGASANAIASAIVKDVYSGKKQQSVLAIVQSMTMFCPAVAPIIGAFLQTFTSWRGVFYAQAAVGLVVLIGSFIYKETIPQRNDVSVVRALGRLWPVLKYGKFALMLFIFSIPGAAIMSWVSTSSYIYEGTFGVSNQAYSYFFAFVAVIQVLGPLSYVFFSRFLSRFTILTVDFAAMIFFGILIARFGGLSPWTLALLMAAAGFMGGMTRPGSTFMMLNNKEGDSGSAASLMGSMGMLAGSIGMFLIPLFSDYIAVIGIIHVIVGVVSGLLWVIFFSRNRG